MFISSVWAFIYAPMTYKYHSTFIYKSPVYRLSGAAQDPSPATRIASLNCRSIDL